MDRFLRGEEGLISLLTPHIPFTLQSQLDQKVHRDDHNAHATTLTTHATTLGTLDSGKQATITADNAGDIKTALGLTNVNNTTDAAKPVSSATQTALNGKQATIDSTNAGDIKTALSLASVDNTTDAAKPVSSATQTALDDKLSITGVVAPLTIKTQNGAVDSAPALTLFHETGELTKAYTSLELKVKSWSNYVNGDRHPSVKMVYEYDNGDDEFGPQTPVIGKLYYTFIDRIGIQTTTQHTGPYFHNNGLADFAGGSLTGAASIQATGAVTCSTLVVKNIESDGTQSGFNTQ